MMKERAPRNRTLTVLEEEKSELMRETVQLTTPCTADAIGGKLIYGDALSCLEFLHATVKPSEA